MADVSGLILTVIGISLDVASRIYRYSQDVKTASAGMQGLGNELFALIGVLEHVKLQRQHLNPTTPSETSGLKGLNSMQKILEETLVFLQGLKSSLDSPQGRLKNTVQKLKWPLKEKETNSYLERLERVKTYFILSQVTEEIDRTQDVAQQIADLSERVEESRLEQRAEDIEYASAKISDWLSPIKPQTTAEKVQKYRVAGSGSWFTKSKPFLSWLSSTQSSTFWLNGITGSGKTTLMTTAVEALRAEGVKVDFGYFYCSFASTESLEDTTILGSILLQLYQSSEVSLKGLEPLYRASGGQVKGSTQPNRIDAGRLVELIVKHVSKAQEVFLFIDGINECGDPESVLSSLRRIIESCSKVVIHLFLSSIDEKGIGSCLQAFPDVRVVILRQSQLHDDIGLLVKASLESNPRLRRYKEDLKSDIQWALTKGAHGMFRWVQCQLDTLSRLRTPGAIREALTRLPPTLDKTYEGLLQRIDDEEDKVLAREILGILAFTFRPLRLREVCEALQITPGLKTLDESKCLADPIDILSICGSLLTYSEETGVVTLAHHSVKAYLTSDLQGKNAFFRLFPESAHKNLARKCLTYLLMDAFSDGPCPSAGTLQARYTQCPLLEYAAQRWADHVRNVENLDDSIWEPMKWFLFSADQGRGNFHAWVQMLLPNSDISCITKTPPLYYAASYGLTEVVKFLLNAGADMEVHAGRGGATPLNIASFRGHHDVAKLLLDRGANPHAVDRYARWSAIEWARYNGHTKIYKVLTESEDGIDDATPFDRAAARAELISRRQQMGDLGAQTITVAQADIAQSWKMSRESRRLWWTLIAKAESSSEHPSGKAILDFAHQYMRLHSSVIMRCTVLHFEAISGRGVSAYIELETPEPSRTYYVLVGTRNLLATKGVKPPADIDTDIDRLTREFPDSTKVKQFSLIFVAIDDEYAGSLALADGNGSSRRLEEKNAENPDGNPSYATQLTQDQKLSDGRGRLQSSSPLHGAGITKRPNRKESHERH